MICCFTIARYFVSLLRKSVHAHLPENSTVSKNIIPLTVVAAQLSGAPGLRAQDGISPMDHSVLVGARVIRAERFAALLFLALAVVALHIMGVVDRSVAVAICNGVAVRRFYAIVSPMTRCAMRSEKDSHVIG